MSCHSLVFTPRELPYPVFDSVLFQVIPHFMKHPYATILSNSWSTLQGFRVLSSLLWRLWSTQPEEFYYFSCSYSIYCLDLYSFLHILSLLLWCRRILQNMAIFYLFLDYLLYQPGAFQWLKIAWWSLISGFYISQYWLTAVANNLQVSVID